MTGGASELQRRDRTISMAAVGLLLLLHFLLRPWLTGLPVGPDLLIGAFLLASLRLQAGTSAILGAVLGPLEAAMVLDDPGMYAFVFVVAGYVAARSRDVLFADAPVFIMVYLFVGTWLTRSALILLGGAPTGAGVAIFVAGLDALATALVCGFVDVVASSVVRRA